jgi:hypothetical protein
MTAVRIGLTAAAVQERAQPSLHTVTHPITPCEIQISKSLLEIMNDWGELTRYTQQNSKTEKLLLQLIVESFGALHQGSSLKSPNIQESECDRLSSIHI